MATVTTRKLKDELSTYLRRAEAGERIVVLRGQVPVAEILPFVAGSQNDDTTILAALGAAGLVDLGTHNTDFSQAGVHLSPGPSASDMVSEDRR